MSHVAIISAVNHRRIRRARAWLESRAAAEEVLIVGATLDAANELARGVAKQKGAAFGWHRLRGRDRWRRRIDGLANDLRLRLSELAEEDETQAATLSRTLQDLAAFAGYAIPLIEVLDSLPASTNWGGSTSWVRSRHERLASVAAGQREGREYPLRQRQDHRPGPR